ncbi:hypothetical protein Hanom_Chr02g00178381 [Helianthus anomalus]
MTVIKRYMCKNASHKPKVREPLGHSVYTYIQFTFQKGEWHQIYSELSYCTPTPSLLLFYTVSPCWSPLSPGSKPHGDSYHFGFSG